MQRDAFGQQEGRRSGFRSQSSKVSRPCGTRNRTHEERVAGNFGEKQLLEECVAGRGAGAGGHRQRAGRSSTPRPPRPRAARRPPRSPSAAPTSARAPARGTRRVQLVRRDGRDGSTLYGRGGGGGGGGGTISAASLNFRTRSVATDLRDAAPSGESGRGSGGRGGDTLCGRHACTFVCALRAGHVSSTRIRFF